MNKLEKLPEITDRALNGLIADESLRSRILNAATREDKTSAFIKPLRFVPALLFSVALMILCVFLLNGKQALLPADEQNLIHSFSAGNSNSVYVSFDSFSETNPETVQSIELQSTGKRSDREQLDQLLKLIKEHSEPVTVQEFVMHDQLSFYGSSGLLFSLPAEAPYIEWSDGIRICESFFESFGSSAD